MCGIEAHGLDLLNLVSLTDYLVCVAYQFILLILMLCVFLLNRAFHFEKLLSHLV